MMALSPGHAIALTAIICGTFVLCYLGTMGFKAGKQRPREFSEDEAETLNEVLDGLKKMEERIENLETILMSKIKQVEQEKKV
jgi:hypothetical protein